MINPKVIEALRNACAADTAFCDWQGGFHGHCGCVAHVVQQLYGGDLLSASINGVQHIWNRLPDGEEIDLTWEQFPEGTVRPKGRVLPIRRTVNQRYQRYMDRYTDERIKQYDS